MLGSQILEVAIGMVFMYLLLSLICSALGEWVASLVSLRAKNLKNGIQHILNDSQGIGLCKELYEHPFIRNLFDPGKRVIRFLLPKKEKEPAYIHPKIFAAALLDTIVPYDSTNSPKSFDSVRDSLTKIQNSEIKKTLLVLFDQAKGDLHTAQENVEHWFNESMEQVSVWYKKQSQLIIFLLALVVSFLANADTLMIADRLLHDATLRAYIVAAAEDTASNNPKLPTDTIEKKIKFINSELDKLNLPIGWVSRDGDAQGIPSDFWGWIIKFVGIALTTVAVSLGAPFWFDLLNKLVNLRSEGKRPEPTRKK